MRLYRCSLEVKSGLAARQIITRRSTRASCDAPAGSLRHADSSASSSGPYSRVSIPPRTRGCNSPTDSLEDFRSRQPARCICKNAADALKLRGRKERVDRHNSQRINRSDTSNIAQTLCNFIPIVYQSRISKSGRRTKNRLIWEGKYGSARFSLIRRDDWIAIQCFQLSDVSATV